GHCDMNPIKMKTTSRDQVDSTKGKCPTTGSASDFIPERKTLKSLAAAAGTCRGCSLYCHATQVVFGEGPQNAEIVLVGEQPGDKEDLAGTRFVGPAGGLLNEVLATSWIDRRLVYVTNAVKHFKWMPRGKRRLHSKPTWKEVTACKPWLMEELRLISPAVT